MASSFSSESANCHLDELYKKEKDAEAGKEQLQNLLKISPSTEERWKIVDALKSLNDVIALIMQERMQIVDKMKRQMEIGRFLICFMFLSSFHVSYFCQIGITRSPSKKMRRSLPPPTSGFKWTPEILEAYGISFKDVYSVDELVFQTAPATSGTYFLHICLSKTWFCLIKIHLMIAINNNLDKILFEKKKKY
jgi:hypothetical protein